MQTLDNSDSYCKCKYIFLAFFMDSTCYFCLSLWGHQSLTLQRKQVLWRGSGNKGVSLTWEAPYFYLHLPFQQLLNLFSYSIWAILVALELCNLFSMPPCRKSGQWQEVVGVTGLSAAGRCVHWNSKCILSHFLDMTNKNTSDILWFKSVSLRT